MARKRGKPKPEFKLPSHLVPDLDQRGTPAEDRKTELRNAWLEANELSFEYFFQWVPAHLAERSRLADLPPRPPARRRDPLPESVRKLLADLEINDDEEIPPNPAAKRKEMTT